MIKRRTEMEYIIQLSKKLNKMLEENEKAKAKYNKMKIPDWFDDREGHEREINKLSKEDQDIYYNRGVIYKRAETQRVRIELNKELIKRGF